MGSLVDHKLAAECCQFFRQLPSDAQRLGWTVEELWDRERKVLERILELCREEVLSATLSNWLGAGLCGVYVRSIHKPPYTLVYLLGEESAVLYAAIRRAIGSVGVSGKQFHEHVKDCVAQAIVEESLEKTIEVRGLKVRPLLELLSTVTFERARFIIAHLSEGQRADLRKRLLVELGSKPRLLPMDRELSLPAEPTLEQRYAWLHHYLWRWRMHSAEMRDRLGGVPRIIAVADGDSMLINRRTGLPADPLASIHVQVWRALGRELNKKSHPIKDPESESRLARSAGMSRDKLRCLPKLPIKITPDGNGRIHFEFSDEDLLKAIEASYRKKPEKLIGT